MIASSLLTVSFFTVDKVVSDDTQTIIWLTADWHCDIITGDYSYAFNNAWDAINDTNAMNVDYAFLVGDAMSWYDPGAGYPDPQSGPYPISCGRFETLWNNLSVSKYKNWSIGNHDAGWWNYDSDIIMTPRASGSGGQYYYYDLGNTSGGGVRVIMMADEGTVSGGTWSGHGEISLTQYNWVNTTITSAYANNMNVFIFMHQKIPGTHAGSQSSAYQVTAPIGPLLAYWNGQSKPISLFACGHSHDSCLGSNDWIETYQGTTNVLICSIAKWSSNHDPCSRYLYFTEGSTSVTIKAYNHYTDSFYAANDYTFELLYDWIPDDNGGSNPEEPEDDISIQSINGLSNNSITSNVNRSFNWTKINNTSCYNLQISNSSDFSTVFLNLSDINELNYAAYYTEKGSYVEFYLPYAYNISFYGDHYYRVRAYSYS